jgi:ubiquinone/menaquinone biosynthesis C-methylase UbiE
MGLWNNARLGGQKEFVSPVKQFAAPASSDLIRMSLLSPPRCFNDDEPEWIDRPGVATALLQEELRTLESLNRRLGGHWLMRRYVQKLSGETQTQPLRVLDLGTGRADIPRAIVGWARKAELPITVVAVDGNPVVLEAAREACRGWAEISLEQHDLRALPYRPASFDVVLCSLTLHHLNQGDAVALLRRMRDIARVGCVVNDLRRNWGAIWIMELLARTVVRSPILRHDGPQSCRAAFTVRELRDMAEQAGFKDFQVRRHHGVFRMVLLGRK